MSSPAPNNNTTRKVKIIKRKIDWSKVSWTRVAGRRRPPDEIDILCEQFCDLDLSGAREEYLHKLFELFKHTLTPEGVLEVRNSQIESSQLAVNRLEDCAPRKKRQLVCKSVHKKLEVQNSQIESSQVAVNQLEDCAPRKKRRLVCKSVHKK
jgi:predicted metalloprotease